MAHEKVNNYEIRFTVLKVYEPHAELRCYLPPFMPFHHHHPETHSLMLLLDIATVHTSFQTHLGTLKAHSRVHSILPRNFTFGEIKRLPFTWKSFPRLDIKFRHKETRCSKLLIKAITTLEHTNPIREGHDSSQPNSDQATSMNQSQPSTDDLEEVDDREKLRRLRISKANKGNTPWNKGRKHSAETLQRIKERTRIAMQDPKVKMKLINLGHAQSKETRVKIGIGVQIGWQRRREKLMLQETCYFEWMNLVAEASRRGHAGEEELQWDSYKVMDERLAQEWIDSVEQRKNTPRPKGSKRGPKSPEQRRRISEAISAKWSDPGYRDRVCSALAKYHGSPVGVERKIRRQRPTGDTQPRERNRAMKKIIEGKSSTPKPKPKKNKRPLYKDPLANSKLEMIKNIRAQRVAAESSKSEAIERARLLIAEAEKAALSLEVAAKRSPLARASLVETRKLIAEAYQTIESINIEQITLDQNVNNPTYTNHVDDEDIDARSEGQNGVDKSKINGNHYPVLSNHEDFDFVKLALQNLLDEDDEDDEELFPPSSEEYGLPSLDFDTLIKKVAQPDQNGNIKLNGIGIQKKEEESPLSSNTITKKWVCGRLIEVQGD